MEVMALKEEVEWIARRLENLNLSNEEFAPTYNIYIAAFEYSSESTVDGSFLLQALNYNVLIVQTQSKVIQSLDEPCAISLELADMLELFVVFGYNNASKIYYFTCLDIILVSCRVMKTIIFENKDINKEVAILSKTRKILTPNFFISDMLSTFNILEEGWTRII